MCTDGEEEEEPVWHGQYLYHLLLVIHCTCIFYMNSLMSFQKAVTNNTSLLASTERQMVPMIPDGVFRPVAYQVTGNAKQRVRLRSVTVAFAAQNKGHLKGYLPDGTLL